MKLGYYIKVLLVFFTAQCLFGQTSVMTYNIRYDNPDDGENTWSNRQQELTAMLNHYAPDILGVQEGLFHQVSSVNDALPDYNYYGVGREDALTQGEYAAIFYNTDTFDLLVRETFWLSETPNEVSVGWDAALERIVTYAVLWHKQQQTAYHVFNAHYDHKGVMARAQSSRLIINLIHQKKLWHKHLIVMGDFNSLADEPPIEILTERLDDTCVKAKNIESQPHNTFNAFQNLPIPNTRIDYILTKNLEIIDYKTITDKRSNSLQLSDHFPVMVMVKPIGK